MIYHVFYHVYIFSHSVYHFSSLIVSLPSQSLSKYRSSCVIRPYFPSYFTFPSPTRLPSFYPVKILSLILLYFLVSAFFLSSPLPCLPFQFLSSQFSPRPSLPLPPLPSPPLLPPLSPFHSLSPGSPSPLSAHHAQIIPNSGVYGEKGRKQPPHGHIQQTLPGHGK